MTSSLSPKEWPVARVELIHDERGAVFEIATGAGCLDAACNALAQLYGVTAPIRSLEVQYGISSEPPVGLPVVNATVDVAVGERIFRGSTTSGDLLVSAVGAYLDALSQAFGPDFPLRGERH